MAYDERMFRRVNGVPYMGNVELRPIYEAAKEFERVAGFIPAHQVRQELVAKLLQGKKTEEPLNGPK